MEQAQRATQPNRLTVKQALQAIQPPIGRTTLYRLLAAQKLRAVKRGRTTLIEADSVESYLASLPSAEFRTPANVVKAA